MAELIQMAQDFLAGNKGNTGNTSARSNRQGNASQVPSSKNTRGNSQQSGNNVSDGRKAGAAASSNAPKAKPAPK